MCNNVGKGPCRLLKLGFSHYKPPDTPIDETELYLSIIERDDKGRTYGLGWTPSGSNCRHTGAKAGAGSSRPISAHDEPIEMLRKDIKEMLTNLLWVMQDNTLCRDELLARTDRSHGAGSNGPTWDFIRASTRCS
ncbi:hypothetical protein Scep_014113 [Stephania cephalantha]|uniref:Uncharacterized protein n=1 Tax=Stephania cephalantha TaxID=152367 RepID=A0AAP0J2N7_9MAGN